MVQKWSERDNLWVWVFEMNEEVPEGLGQCWTSLRWNKIMAKEDASGVGDDSAKKINSVDENLEAPKTLSQSSGIKEYGIKPLGIDLQFLYPYLWQASVHTIFHWHLGSGS
jgi:hypothetical protein